MTSGPPTEPAGAPGPPPAPYGTPESLTGRPAAPAPPGPGPRADRPGPYDVPSAPGDRTPWFGTPESVAGVPRGSLPAPATGGVPTPQDGTLATSGARLVARLLDIVLLGIVLLAVLVPIWQVMLDGDPALRQQILEYSANGGSPATALELQQSFLPYYAISVGIALLLWFLYEVPLTARRGQTFGKMVVRIRVSGAGGPAGARDAAGPGWSAALRRWLLLGVPGLLGTVGGIFQLLDCAWLLWDRRRQCLHDKVGRTLVVPVSPTPR